MTWRLLVVTLAGALCSCTSSTSQDGVAPAAGTAALTGVETPVGPLRAAGQDDFQLFPQVFAIDGGFLVLFADGNLFPVSAVRVTLDGGTSALQRWVVPAGDVYAATRRTGGYSITGLDVGLRVRTEQLDDALVSLDASVVLGQTNSSRAMSMAWNGAQTLIAWGVPDAGAVDIWAARRLDDGALLDSPGFLVTQGAGGPPRVVWSGSTNLVITRSKPTGLQLSRVGSDGTVLDATPNPLPFALSAVDYAPSVSGQQVLVPWVDQTLSPTLWTAKAQRLDLDGGPLDSAALTLAGPLGAFNASSSIRSIVADAVPNGWLVSWFQANQVRSREVFFDGGFSAVTTLYSANEAAVGDVAVGCGESMCLTAFELNRDIYGVRQRLDGTPIDTTRRLLNVAGAAQFSGSVASNGARFLVAWAEHGVPVDQVYAVRVDPDGGVVGSPMLVGAGDFIASVRVASVPPDFLVAWQARLPTSSVIRAAHVTATGMVLDPGGFVASGGTWATDMSLAASRSNYMLSWMADVSGPVLYGVRVGVTTTLLEAPAKLTPGQIGFVVGPCVAAADDTYFVAHISMPGFTAGYATIAPDAGLLAAPAKLMADPFSIQGIGCATVPGRAVLTVQNAWADGGASTRYLWLSSDGGGVTDDQPPEVTLSFLTRPTLLWTGNELLRMVYTLVDGGGGLVEATVTDGGGTAAWALRVNGGPPHVAEAQGSVLAVYDRFDPSPSVLARRAFFQVATPFDAGPADAGPSDAGPADAGPPDAGPSDAGPPDAGPPDAGPPDAGPSDAGTSDAGPSDAGAGDAGDDAGLERADAGAPQGDAGDDAGIDAGESPASDAGTDVDGGARSAHLTVSCDCAQLPGPEVLFIVLALAARPRRRQGL